MSDAILVALCFIAAALVIAGCAAYSRKLDREHERSN